MTMNNYFFVDGSALLGDIQRARVALGISTNARLDLLAFVRHFTGDKYGAFHQGGYRRFVFYFVKEDRRLGTSVILPNTAIPGVINDVRIQYCGKHISETAKAHRWLEDNRAPGYVQDCAHRSEKAVDTKICCDALQLAGIGKLDRLFLYTNDYDFAPLFHALRTMGANVNLFRLRPDKLNKELAAECDALHVMSDEDLRASFKEPSH